MNTRNYRYYYVVIALILFSYIFAWVQMYIKAKGYFREAMDSYGRRDYIAALKGKKIPVLSTDGSDFKGGFEQVEAIFSSSYCFPKPGIYWDAVDRAREIINEKIIPAQAIEAYHKFFGLDNRYIGEMLLRAGDIYMNERKFDEAEKTYTLAIESFPYNDSITKPAGIKAAIAGEKIKKRN